MDISLGMSARDVALRSARAVEILERAGIDYFQHGDLPLARACQAAHVSPRELVRALHEAPEESPASDLRCASLSELVDHLMVTTHPAMLSACARIETLLAPCTARTRDDVREATEAVREQVACDTMETFPLVRAFELARNGAGAWPADPPEALHERLGESSQSLWHADALLRDAREALRVERAPEALLEETASLAAALHRHALLVNNLLAPRAHELIPDRRLRWRGPTTA